MDSISELFAGILEFFVRILYGVIRLIIWVIGFVLSKTWLVNHFGALRWFGLWLAISSGLYLLFGILRASAPELASPALTPVFQWQIVLIMMVLLLVGIALRELDPKHYIPDNTRHAFEPTAPAPPTQAAPVKAGTPRTSQDSPIQTTPTIHSSGLVAAIVLIALAVGIISAVTSERHEATLAEKLCDQADARISDGLEQSVRDGAGLLDRVLGTQTADRIPCGDD